MDRPRSPQTPLYGHPEVHHYPLVVVVLPLRNPDISQLQSLPPTHLDCVTNPGTRFPSYNFRMAREATGAKSPGPKDTTKLTTLGYPVPHGGPLF